MLCFTTDTLDELLNMNKLLSLFQQPLINIVRLIVNKYLGKYILPSLPSRIFKCQVIPNPLAAEKAPYFFYKRCNISLTVIYSLYAYYKKCTALAYFKTKIKCEEVRDLILFKASKRLLSYLEIRPCEGIQIYSRNCKIRLINRFAIELFNTITLMSRVDWVFVSEHLQTAGYLQVFFYYHFFMQNIISIIEE